VEVQQGVRRAEPRERSKEIFFISESSPASPLLRAPWAVRLTGDRFYARDNNGDASTAVHAGCTRQKRYCIESERGAMARERYVGTVHEGI
jgi:hypothetical protein